ncbi:hypothetical protein BOTBODRAFT_419179 [Botryobasidium botryosum FD-172 SS1]|uniref:F-box domain-containing protein n=1 Tax=Botryobasidium botryosum (strain FD-172 SS1) TaxID=930990 RepID=A0A067M9K8_BOTB1|nr:hypothetical protein BOTBODRAFT_419179 [Botryobasidium botryosum FD-172 SS1]
MSLTTQLDFDTLSAICSMLGTRSLLSLAITTRSVHDIIVPRFLYARVRIGSESSARLFYRRLLLGGPTVECIVRHFEFSTDKLPSLEVADMLVEMLERMNQLRSVKLTLYWDLLPRTPRIYKALVSQAGLRDLTLEYPSDCTFPSPDLPSFGDLRDINSLCSFHIISDANANDVVISAESDFGVILLNSQDTLELTLPHCIQWDFRPSVPAVSIDEGPIWPHVRGFSLGSLESHRGLDLK